ncbi:MAG: GTPase Era, partial [Propionibacterium sp.]
MRIAMTKTHRSGFVCFVGRPNAGKSSLTNVLVGQKIAISSSKPQTTRHTIRGIVTRDNGQMVIIDTPGLHRPRTLLGERLNHLVHETWAEVDVIGVCLPSDQRIGPGDTYLVNKIAELVNRPALVALATKTDLVSKQRLLSHLVDIDNLAKKVGIEWASVVPCSAVT